MAYTPPAETVFARALGQRLREARIRAGITSICAAARAIGCSNSCLKHWEVGDYEPRPSALIRIAEVYQTSVVELLGIAA